jgi:plastocyanin
MKKKLLAIASLLSLAACEGEPPKTPLSQAVAVEPQPASGAAVGEPPAEPSPPTAAAGPGALPACACNCGCNGGGTIAALDGGAPGDGASPPLAVAAVSPPVVLASISGNVTSTPKGAAASAVIYLEGAPVEPNARMTTTVTNRMMNFIPFVSVVPVGGKIIFRNDDPFPHNVFSADGERFNMGMIPQHEARVRTFKSAGAYSLLCNVHPGMLGYVVIAPSSYYAKADSQGHFVIKGVPPGTYTVTAWAPRQKVASQPVTVKDGDVPINFELHR